MENLNINNLSNNMLLKKMIKNLFLNYAITLIDHNGSNDGTLSDLYKLNIKCGHLFYINTSESINNCHCGLYSCSNKNDFIDIFDDNNESYLINSSSDFLVASNLNGESLLTKSTSNVNILDCAESKLNSFKLVRNILSTILQIGVFIYD
jgi:hypothetical protein